MPPTSSISSVLRWLLACLLLLITPFAQAALTINNDGTVTDPNTGLTWMRCSMGQTWDGSTCTGTASTHTFDQANALANMVTFAGQNDWRLPNIRELQTIVDRSVYSPAIDGVAFPNTPSWNFWSGSPYAGNSGYAWVVYFDAGYAYSNSGQSFNLAVRLVRGGQSFVPLVGIARPTSDYVDNGNGTVTHKPTNLTWQRCAQGQTWTGSTCSGTASAYTFDQANALTGTTIFAGQSDWRVPTEDELLSLLDYTIAITEQPMINGSTFPETPAGFGSYFWSGSPYANGSSYAWHVNFENGDAYDYARGGDGAVRLVRGGQSFGSLVLMISKSGAGTGTVTSSPSGINCGNTCSEFFTSGTSVDLTATPATGSTFTGWSGACTGTQSCTVSMTAAQGVTATFAPSVTSPVCTLSANSSTIVVGSSSTLTASCSPVATSYTWTGDTCAGTTGSTCTVTPAATTTYTVAGTNADGTGTTASATVTVTSSSSDLQPNADGTVFDPKTGLTWIRCAMGQTWDGSTCTGTASTSTFDQANTLTGMVIFSGQNDWRMPNIRELQTIVDRSVYSPAINSVAFPNTPSSDFWSDSLLADNSVSAWSVNFDYGYASAIGRSDGYYAVRLVRGGQSFGSLVSITRPTSDYVDNDNGTVTHTPTNLTWKRCTQGQTWTGSTCTGTASTYTFDQANGLTGATTFAGQSDWRVPTEDELLSLVDYTIANPGPMINSSIFPATPDTYYSYLWSSSPLANASDGAWYVYFGSGYPLSGYRGSNMGVVQLVRGGQSIGPFALTISKSGTGTGTITSSPAGISCDSTCSASFTSDTSVTLTATPATDSTFSGWSGACTGTGSCTVSMTAAKNVTATFTLSILAPVCTLSANPATITAGSSATLTASCTPAATSYTWTGGTCAGTTGTTCTATPAATTTYTVAGTNTGGIGTAASATVTVNACTYALGASSASVSASASTGNVSVTATCAWTATSNASWLTIASGASGSGNGTVAYTVAANTGTSSRTGTLTVAGQTFTVTQGISPPACTLSANPATITVGSSATLTASCTPAATSYTWTGGTCAGTTGTTCTATPAATTTYTVAGTNAGGTGTAASATVTVNACTYALGASSASVSASASTGNVSVTSSCAWTATSNSSWISITSGASGSGNGTVAYAVAANAGTTARTGTLTIAGKTFTVTQGISPPACTLSASPSSITVGSSTTLTASCSPATTSYTWTGGTCAGTTGASCTATPTATTTYTVAGTNAGGTGTAASAIVTVTSSGALHLNADGTVFDPKTGLTWMRCSIGQTWTGNACSGRAKAYTFDEANALMGTVEFADQSDWRMPTIRELQTIVDRSVYDPAIDSAAFPNTPRSNAWSGSPSASGSILAWLVNFTYGSAYFGNRGNSYAVRLVRGGQSFGPLLDITRPTSDYVDNEDGTVTHTPTTLTWKRCAQGQTWTGSLCIGTASTYTFEQANALTGTTTFAGQSDWRLPTEDELVSLVDYAISSPGPTINSNVFPATPSSYFRSGSPSANLSNLAWYVYFYYGNADGNFRGNSFAVRLVRGGQFLGPLALTVGKSGSGTGTITSSPTGINCGSTCSASFPNGTSVTLTATPTTDSTFTGWSGACTGTGSCTVSMTAAKSITATFTLSVTAPVCTLSANPSSITAGSSATLTASCSPAATSYTWTGGTCAGSTGTTCTVTPTATTTYTVAGTNAGGTGAAASASVTVASVGGAPVCTLSANPASITAGGSSTLKATCNPTATSYIWTGGTCAGASVSSCTVTPTAATTYSVQGINTSGAYQAISTTVTVATNAISYAVPGTLGNDVFVLTAGNTYYGGGGNDTFIISPNTLRGDVTAKIVDSEGDNLIQLVDGMTVTASSFYADAAQLTLSGGATVQILGASKFKFQVGANAPAGDAATILTYAQFVSSLGASLTSGTLPASGTAGYVVPTGFTQASAPAPAVVGSSYTVPGTVGDDVLVPSGGNNYLGGGGNDTYLISSYTLSGTVTVKIIDSEGANVIQLAKGLTIASSTFYNNAMQLTLSNGATVQILGASGFVYQLGANAPAGETASSLSYAQFAATLGASVPTGTSAVGGSANFVVSR